MAPPVEMMKKTVLYARVSSKEQQEDGFSIPAQLKLLKEYAAKQGFQIAREFVDVETAKQEGRTSFGQMIGFLKESPSIQNVLVEKTDRLYRNFRDYVTVDDLIANGLTIHLVKESEILGQNSKSHQKFIHGIKVLMAKNYIDNLSEEVKKGMQEKAEQGEYPSTAPIGYRNDAVTHLLVLQEEDGRAIKSLCEMFITGNYSLSQLRQAGIDAGLRGRVSGRSLSRSEIERILKSPIYYGAFWWKGRLYQGKHEPIISKELFDLVQKTLADRHRATRAKRYSFTFSGIFRCGYCGCTLSAERHKGKYVYYRCTQSRGPCQQKFLKEELIDEIAAGLVKRIQLEENLLDWLRETLRQSHADEQAFHDAQIEALEEKEKAIQRRLDQIYIDKLDGKITEEFWRQKTDEWRAEQDEIRRKLVLHRQANRSYIEEGVKILELTQHAPAFYLRATPEEKREILKTVLSNCALKDATPIPVYNKPFGWMVDLADFKGERPRRDSNPCFSLERAAS